MKIMWLPKDERHLLMAYYVNVFNVDDRDVSRYLHNPKWFEMQDWLCILKKPCWIPILTPLLVKYAARKVKTYGDGDKTPSKNDKSVAQFKEEIKNHIKLKRRLEIVNAGLKKRNLINIQEHEGCQDVAGISLTIEGQDLGRKYNSWWTRSGLWFAEYKHHWFWLIVSFLGGIMGALIVNWLSRVD